MLYALSPVSKSTTLDDLKGHYCVFDVVTISTEVYLFIILCDVVCLRRSLVCKELMSCSILYGANRRWL